MGSFSSRTTRKSSRWRSGWRRRGGELLEERALYQGGLPLGDNVTAFSFKDLTKLGDELSQAFSIVGVIQPFLPPDVAKDPTLITLISAITKVSRVVKTLDFYRSTCSVSTLTASSARRNGRELPGAAEAQGAGIRSGRYAAESGCGEKPATEKKAEKPNG